MSTEKPKGSFYKDIVETTAKATVAGAAAGLVGIGVIVVRNHKELAHRNIQLHPGVQRVMDFEQRSSGVGDATIWAAVHREPHHGVPDASLFRFYQIARAANWLEQNPQARDSITIPDYFKKLDPGVTSFSREDVLEIGNQAIDIMKKKLGDEYKDPKNYTSDELKELFNPDPPKPTYWYPPYEKHTGAYTQDEIAQIFLTDPHSAVLMPPHKRRTNGVRGVLRSNVYLYKKAADLFRVRPDLKPQDLQTGKEADYKKPVKEIIAAFVLPTTAVLFMRRKYKPEDFLIAAVAGSAFNGARYVKIPGGNIVNALGHPGKLESSEDLQDAVLKKDYYIPPNPDGTYTADTTRAGVLGKLVKLFTLDEADQRAHHERPESVPHLSDPNLKGADAWYDAPFGSFIDALAKSKRVPWIQEGEGFGVPKNERPDMPHPAALKIQKLRKEQLAK